MKNIKGKTGFFFWRMEKLSNTVRVLKEEIIEFQQICLSKFCHGSGKWLNCCSVLQLQHGLKTAGTSTKI
jgi:hypothetical protein